MRELDSVFKEKKSKPASLVRQNKNEAIPKKIYEDDYELIRNYAFHNDITMTQTTERILNYINEQNINNYDDFFKNVEERADEIKSMRMSKKFFKKIKEINHITRIPMLQLISFCVQITIKEEKI